MNANNPPASPSQGPRLCVKKIATNWAASKIVYVTVSNASRKLPFVKRNNASVSAQYANANATPNAKSKTQTRMSAPPATAMMPMVSTRVGVPRVSRASVSIQRAKVSGTTKIKYAATKIELPIFAATRSVVSPPQGSGSSLKC